METKRYHRTRDIFIVSCGIALLGYIIARILNVSMSCDENGSYFMFASEGEIFPRTYDFFSANNHALNTAMMVLSEKLFGTNQFAIRFPNLIGAVLYVISTGMMCRRIRSPFVGMLAFLVLDTNPYMIQYFCVARGYGIAAGCMSFAFWQLWLYYDNGYRMRNLAPAIIAGTLAVFANYSYLNLFLPVAGFAGLIALWRPGSTNVPVLSRIIPPAFIAAFVIGSLIVIIPIGQAIKNAGGFWQTGTIYFWTQSIASIVDCSLYDITRADRVIQFIVKVIAELYGIASLAIVAWTMVKWKDGERPLFPVFVFIVLTLSGLSVMIQFWLLDTEIVIQRMGLFMLWPFLLLISLAAGLSAKFNAFVHVPFTIITGILVWHFFSTASLDKETFHPYSENVMETIEYMQESAPGNERIRIGIDNSIYVSGFEFYLHTTHAQEFDVVIADSMWTHPLNQYCFVIGESAGKVTKEGWTAVQRFENGNVLYRNTDPPVMVQSKQLNKISDTMITLTETGGLLNASYRWTDTLNDSLKALVRVKFLMKRERFAWGGSWVSLFHGGKEVYVHRTDLRKFPHTEDWIPVEYTVVLPLLAAGDDIVAGTYWEHGGEIQLKNFSIGVEAYQ